MINLFNKVSECRETNDVSQKKAKSAITEGLSDCMDTCCRNET